MVDLRIVDAPVLLQEMITDDVKMPTGGLGNYAIRLGDLVWYTITKEQLTNKSYVDNSSKGVQDELDGHIADKDNPHQVTKTQVGLDQVDNTADIDKPVSNAVSSAIIEATTDMATTFFVKNSTYTQAEINTKLALVSGGYIGAFSTFSELQAKTGMTTGQVAKVMNDSDTAKNGDYHFDGSTWVKGYSAIDDANPMFKKVQLKDGDDLNNINKTGVYYNYADLTATQLKNMPSYPIDNAVLGTLVVYSPFEVNHNALYQVFYPHNELAIYLRKQNTDLSWSAWDKLITESKRDKGVMLTSGVDVLTLPVGSYSWDDFPVGNALQNMPNVTYKYGRLVVKTTANDDVGYYKQVEFYPYGRHKEFYINKNFESGWTGWMRYADVDTIKSEVTNAQSAYTPSIITPPRFYALEGIESHIYPEHLVIDDFTLYNHRAFAYRGKHKNRGFVWTPNQTTDGAGQYGVTWSLFDKQTASELAKSTLLFTLVDKNKDSGITKKVMVIGDSYINSGVITQQILDCAANDVTKVQLIGTRGSGSNKHEGRSGWKISDYTSSRSDNPFWINGKVDYPQYLTNNSLATPDIIIIELGVNDSFAQTTDADVVTMTQTAFSNLDTLIASFKAANANVKIGLCLPPKYADQDAFGNDYGTQYDAWRCSRNIAIYNRELIARYKDSEPQNIYVVASGFNVDTLNNYPTTQELINSQNSTLIDVQNNSVHPYDKGYKQIGDMMFVFIKAI